MNITPPPLTNPYVPPAAPPEPTTLLGRLLRTPQSLLLDEGVGLPARLFLLGLAGTVIYGLVLGSFSGGDQLWAAPLKLTLGLLLALFLCTPSLFVFATLAGAHIEPRQLLTLLGGLLGLAGLLLASLGPVGWVFSQSTQSAAFIGSLHWIFWLVSAGFGLRLVSRGLRVLGARSGGAFGVWAIIFLLVCFQMATTVRPLLGPSPTLLTAEKKSFLTHWNETLTESPARK